MKKTIGILTGGGDVPGLNACIKAVVTRAEEEGFSVLGIRKGWAGLLYFNPEDPAACREECIQPLTRGIVRTIDRSGGTFLHTSRTNPGNVKPAGAPAFVPASGYVVKENGVRDYTRHVLRVLDHLGVGVVIPIGGDDTLGYGARLHAEGVPVVAVPKTMDNDVFGTDFCIGFSTAVTRSVELITALRTNAGSHERIGVIELFGRYSGETSLWAAYLAGVDRAVVSEVPFDPERLARLLMEDKRGNPSRYAVMTISEGARMEGGDRIAMGEEDAFGHKRLGGVGQMTADLLQKITGEGTLYQSLAYLMRCGAPDALDRMVATSFGLLAMELVKAGRTGRMVALVGGKYTHVDAGTCMSGKKHVDIEHFYDAENYRPRILRVEGQPMFFT